MQRDLEDLPNLPMNIVPADIDMITVKSFHLPRFIEVFWEREMSENFRKLPREYPIWNSFKKFSKCCKKRLGPAKGLSPPEKSKHSRSLQYIVSL